MKELGEAIASVTIVMFLITLFALSAAGFIALNMDKQDMLDAALSIEIMECEKDLPRSKKCIGVGTVKVVPNKK